MHSILTQPRVWGHTQPINSRLRSSGELLDVFETNVHQFHWTGMRVCFNFQVLSCCNDHFSRAFNSTKSTFQNTPNIFTSGYWSRYGMVFLLHVSLEFLNVHATIVFEGIRLRNELKWGRALFLATTVHSPIQKHLLAASSHYPSVSRSKPCTGASALVLMVWGNF